MLVCDAFYKDPATGKGTILGTFSSIGGTEFPLQVAGFTLFMSLTDAHGKVPLKIKVVDAADEGDAIAEVGVEVEFQDPIVVMDLIMSVGNIIFPSPGEYRLQLYGNDEFVVERRILIVDTTRPKPEAQQ